MSDNSHNDSGVEPKTGIFRSNSHQPQTLDEALGSAVRSSAVEQVAEVVPAQQLYVGPTVDAVSDQVHVGAFDHVITGSTVAPADEVPHPVAEKAALLNTKVEQTNAALEQVNDMMQTVQARQAELEHSYAQAQQMLHEVEKVHAALTVNDRLRHRIEETLRRTNELKAKLGNDPHGGSH